MASFSSFSICKNQLIAMVFIFIASSSLSGVSGNECFKSIIGFGASKSDTGNFAILAQPIKLPVLSLPNGRTFFNRPTGRYCDGRLLIDFLAQKFRLPLVPPYFGGNKNEFLKGVNFAVGGSTALDNSSLAQKGIINSNTNVSLRVQVGLFRKLLPSICSSRSECNEFFKNSLILMGEIGGNDFNYAISQCFRNESLRGLVPDVIKAISSAIEELIKMGAVKIVVPGNIPVGCQPIFLKLFQTSNQKDYDPSTGCLRWLNDLSQYYNHMLQKEVNKLQKLHPSTDIVYADLFQAAIRFYRSPKQFGFKSTLIACCGAGGSYNLNVSSLCGSPGTKSCKDPSTYASWDGVHFTEAANKLIFKALMNTIPLLNIQCAR